MWLYVFGKVDAPKITEKRNKLGNEKVQREAGSAFSARTDKI